VLVDRRAGAIELSAEGRQSATTFALADRVLLSTDAWGSIAAMTFFDVNCAQGLKPLNRR